MITYDFNVFGCCHRLALESKLEPWMEDPMDGMAKSPIFPTFLGHQRQTNSTPRRVLSLLPTALYCTTRAVAPVALR